MCALSRSTKIVQARQLVNDHVGDTEGLWVGGWLSGRYEPLHIYGPSGSEPRLGTAAFAEGLKAAYAWDIEGRSGTLPDRGGVLTAHEFDYRQENEVVYQKNGVTIRSSPAMEAGKLDVAHTFKDLIDAFKKKHNLK